MRILFLTHTLPFPAERDGMSMMAHHLLPELARRHDLTLWCFDQGEPSEAEAYITRQNITLRQFAKPARKLWRYYLLHAQRMGWFQFQWFSVELFAAVADADASGSYDLIVIHTPFMSEYLRAVRRTPSVLHAVDALSDWFAQTARDESNPLKKIHLGQEARKAARAESTLYPLAGRIMAVAERDADIIGRHARRDVTVIPIGADIAAVPAVPAPSGAPSLVFTGVMDYPPNVEAARSFARDVWPRLSSQHPELTWRIIGKNPAPEVSALAAADSRIVVTGFVPSVIEEIRRATVVIAPMNLGTGFKIKMIEALATGQAVVASPASLPGIPAEDGVHLRVARSTREWVDIVSDLLARPDERRRLGLHARRLAESMAWPSIAARYEHLYALARR